jgi:hypothetical protein
MSAIIGQFPFVCFLLCFRHLIRGHFGGQQIPRKTSGHDPSRRRQAEPHMRPDIILRNASAIKVHKREVVLGIGVALVGCQPKPTDRICIIQPHAPPVLVHQTDSVLSPGVASVSEWAQKAHGGREVTAVPCVRSVLERPCDGRFKNRAGEHQNGDGCFGHEFHPRLQAVSFSVAADCFAWTGSSPSTKAKDRSSGSGGEVRAVLRTSRHELRRRHNRGALSVID